MKSASTATVAILATGEYGIAELYEITPVLGSTTYYFTDFDQPLTVQPYVNGLFQSAQTYETGLTIIRDQLRQKVGVDASDLEFTIAAQPDNPGGAPTIAGYSFPTAARLGVLRGAKVRLLHFIFSNPNGPQIDTSPGAVPFFQGIIGPVNAGRLKVQIKASSNLSLMSVQMPRSVVSVGCAHQVYDAGCTLLASAFTVSGTVSGTPTNGTFTTNLTQVDKYFNLGVITFTSGACNGWSASVRKYLHSSGQVTLFIPLPVAPASGDTFTIYPGCDHQQSTCQNNNSAVGPAFNNLAHFKGMPYVPIPETTLDGGTTNPPSQTQGAQAGQIIGSAISSRRTTS
jgi:hypothetical protein